MVQDDLSLSRYIASTREVPPLSREEEHELALKVRDTNDPRATDKLVKASLRYVVAIALTYRRYGLRLGDLVAEGNVGLVTAVRKFDPDRGTRFVTYAAYWIRAFMLNFVIKSWSMVGTGSGPLRSRLFFRLRRERARVTNLYPEGELALENLAERIGITTEKLGEMLQRLDAHDVSLDQLSLQDGHATAVDLLPDPREPQDETVQSHEVAALLGGRVRGAVDRLDTRERYIVERRMMADEEMSLAEIGRQLGVSRERARQLEARAKKKLRKSLGDLGKVEDLVSVS